MPQKTALIIVGPTAVGKTSLAISVARYLNTEIISADSRQCFKELSIGVAVPTPQQLQLVQHHFIHSHSIQEEVNASLFESYALGAAHKIFLQHDVAVMVGGTGLYIKAFCEGMDEIPPIDDAIRQHIIQQHQQHGLEWLQQQVAEQDPVYYADGEIQNPQRLMRALEVVLSTGRSIRSFQQQKPQQRSFDVIKIGLQLPMETLYQQINHRVDEMMEQGLLEEVKNLLPFKSLNALQTVGYLELFEYLDGRISTEKAVELIKQHTRHYAKRQMTWFRKDETVKWFSPSGIDEIVEYCKVRIQK